MERIVLAKPDQRAAMPPSSPLSPAEIDRYSRQLRIPSVGLDGQLRLKEAKVLIVGTGGLGSPIAAYLAAAGIGTLGLIDYDTVSLSNLQRQLLYTTADIGKPKLWQAKARLEALNPEIRVVAHEGPLDLANAPGLIGAYDIVADGTDNFLARYLLNDVCWQLDKPLVHGSIYRFDGQVAVFARGQGGCYRCLYPSPPVQAPSCAEGGVLGVLAGTIGTLQATEVIKLVLGQGDSLAGGLLLYHALQARLERIAIPQDPACPLCGETPGHLAYPAWTPEAGDTDDSDWDAAMVLSRRAEVTVLDVGETALWPEDGGEYRHLPLSELPGALAGLEPERPLVTVCLTGVAAETAATLLRSAGFANAWHLKGGLLAWQRHQALSGQGEQP